jgi:hypothetical protein
MASSGLLRRVVLVRTDVSEELSASFVRVTRIGELGTTLAVTSNRQTLLKNTWSVLTRATRRNITEDAILHSHRRENLKATQIVCRRMPSSAILRHVTLVRTDVSEEIIALSSG